MLLKVTTNYRTILSPDAMLDLCEDVESSFGKEGKRYISNANESFRDDYYISLHCDSEEEEEDQEDYGTYIIRGREKQ
ncbi:hypothetical protein L218DRAFT_963864 [Marasmius fiardii PR-910]|nr:hypothetical protein L218DRAFT_963864 [Marasmius fiardii PR-910]